MLQIKNLTVTAIKDNRMILRDFSFSLRPGDRAVLIGEEGNGKSTLLKLIYDPQLIAGYAEAAGEIVKNDCLLGYLPQELTEQEKLLPAADFCARSASFREATPERLASISAKLGLSPEYFRSDRPLSTLSGGEKVKLRLALLVLEEPDVLLLDEPSNDLDIEALAWLERFIGSFPAPILYVSHDETVIERTANVIIHLEQVRRKTVPRHTIARIPYRDYINRRLSGFAHQEQVAQKERSDYEKQQEKFRQIQSRVEFEQASVSRADPGGGRLLKKKMKTVKAMGRRFERDHDKMTERPDFEEAILMKFGDNAAYPSGKPLLGLHIDALEAGGRVLSRNIDLHLAGPEKIVITGKNGAGKTTLLRKIAETLLARKDIKAGYMPQDYAEALDNNQTPVELLSKTGDKAETTKIRTFLGSVKYTADEMEHPVSGLSGGQKAKLLFLKLILDGCNVLLLDEPTRNLSPLSNPVLREVLREYKGAVISVSHDRKFIGEVCQKVYRLTEMGLTPAEKPSAE